MCIYGLGSYRLFGGDEVMWGLTGCLGVMRSYRLFGDVGSYRLVGGDVYIYIY
jgi:hypothetical protein